MAKIKKIKKIKGFTLIEIVVSTVIISILSVGSYIAFFVMAQANESNRNRLHAYALSQATMEQIRAVARNNFDNLENYSLPDIDQTKYPGFHRTMVVTREGSAEFKKATVTISWTEKAQAREYNFAMLLSRPPEALPANIHGTVTNSETKAGLGSVYIEITYNSPTPFTLTTSTSNAPAEDRGKYNFADRNGVYRLKTGDWTLKVRPVSGYYNHPDILVTNLSSGEDRVVDIELDPKPDPAYIKGRVVDVLNGKRITHKFVYVSLYENGARRQTVHCNNNGNGFKFTVPFENTNPRSFTIVTSYIGADDRTYLTGYCGNISDIHGWGKSYNYLGWSSSVVSEDGTVKLSNPWYGNSATDRITVSPGKNNYIGDVPLVPIPLATINGHVYDSTGSGVYRARVILGWDSGHWVCDIRTDRNGFYECKVPATQELFPDEPGRRFAVYAAGGVPTVGSCGLSGTTWVSSGWGRLAEGLYAGGVVTHDFHLPDAVPRKYGNAEGYVIDGQSGAPIWKASVKIWDWWTSTDISGKYEFKCDPAQAAFFKIPTGNYWVEVSKEGYYKYVRSGTRIYARQPQVQILAEQTTIVATIRLWPVGKGTIRGRVVDATTSQGIKGARVYLDYYSNGNDRNTVTKQGGEFVFKDVRESWPAVDVVGDPYYNQTPLRHTITVSYGDLYVPERRTGITLTAGETKDLGDIRLSPKGQM